MKRPVLACLCLLGLLVLAACGPRGMGDLLPPRASPPDAGVDAALIRAAAAEAETLPRMRTMIVARNGKVEFERVVRGPGLDTPVNIKSASKTVLAAITGAAIADGVLTGVDQKIAPILGPRVPPEADPRVADITVGHLLSMQAGLASTSGASYGRWAASPDWVAHALSQPMEAEPGGRLIYSTGTSHILSTVLTRASGRSTLALAREYLGEPLDIDIPPWAADPQGVYMGGNEMSLSPRALLKIGELYRNGGVHDGRRVLPAQWIEDSWKPGGRSMWTGAPYGYGWWLKRSNGHDVWFAWGYGGQMIFVVPDLALTVVMTSDPSPRGRDGHVSGLHRLLDQYIVPAARQGAGHATATAASSRSDRSGRPG